MNAMWSNDPQRLEKIRKSIKKSRTFLEDAINAQINKDSKDFEKKMFLALSELEYAQFMVSLVLKSTGFISEIHRNRKSTEDLSPNLVRARDILKEIEPMLGSDLVQYCMKIQDAKRLVLSVMKKVVRQRDNITEYHT
jgi:hypothetical protein